MPNTPPSSIGPDLFSDDRGGPYTVSQLTTDLRAVVEEAFGDVWVVGELSNFKRHRSGHCYFTLKDAEAQVRCVMWRHMTRYLFFEPQDGLRVRLHGNASVYERRGDLQLIARSMQPAGEGELLKAFEALKRRLEREGLFDAASKRPLPPIPGRIGIITSGSGAALHDILTVLQRRFPAVLALVCPVQVQGPGAARSVADAIEAFNSEPANGPLRPDVLIVGRGGGSIEDLWAFNEEVVARAIHASQIPVVSAVGHETDFSIADYVADVRAATPSMAAEICVPDRVELASTIRGFHDAARSALLRRTDLGRRRVQTLTSSHPFCRPVERLRQSAQRVDELCGRLHRSVRKCVHSERERALSLQARLQALDPSRPLQRGYVMVEREGKTVKRAAQLRGGEKVVLRFHDGTRGATIEDVSFQ